MDTSSDSSRGTKRTADDAQFIAAQVPKRIKVQGQNAPNILHHADIPYGPSTKTLSTR